MRERAAGGRKGPVAAAAPERATGLFRPAATASPVVAVVGAATDLVRARLARGLGPHERLTETGCHATLFGPVPADEVRAEAVLLHRGGAASSWQVTLSDTAGRAVAAVTLSYAVVAGEAAMDGSASAIPATALPNAAALADASGKRATGSAAQPVAGQSAGGERASGPDSAGQGGREVAPSPADRRRDIIAAAASDVIARKGFANATMREIAEAAGMHVPTMYQYIASKDEMLELVYNWTMARVRTDVAEATINCRTATEKLAATVASFIEKGDRFRRNIGVLNRELRSLSPEARVRVLEDYQRLIVQIADLVRDGTASGEFRPVEPDIAANVIEAACDIWPLRPFAVGRFGRETFRAEVSAMLLRGLLADPADRP